MKLLIAWILKTSWRGIIANNVWVCVKEFESLYINDLHQNKKKITIHKLNPIIEKNLIEILLERDSSIPSIENLINWENTGKMKYLNTSSTRSIITELIYKLLLKIRFEKLDLNPLPSLSFFDVHLKFLSIILKNEEELNTFPNDKN